MAGRIGLIVYGNLDLASGGYLYDRALVATLCARGWGVHVFPLPPRSYPVNLLDNIRPGLTSSIERAGLDLLLEDELCHASLVALNRDLKSRLGLPIVSIVHHLRSSEQHGYWPRWLHRKVEREYLRSVDAFVFNSPTTADSVTGLSGSEKPSIVARPSGDRFQSRIGAVDIEARTKAALPLRIVFLGNVISRKGLETLIDAVALLPSGAWSLSVLGDLQIDSALTRRVRQRIGSHGLRDRIWLAGRRVDGEVASILRSSHVLAVPSSYEGYGIAYLEAMSFGLPAIGTTQGGASEIIDNGVNGWLVTPRDPQGLARALRSYIDDPKLLLSMSQAALRTSARHPTWSESMDRAATFLETIVTGRNDETA